MPLVILLRAQGITVHESGEGRDLNAAEGANLASPGNAGRQVTSQEAGLVGGENLPQNVGNGRVVGVVDNRELLVRVAQE